MTEEKELTKSIDTVLAELRTISVLNEMQYETAGEFLKKCRETKRFVEDAFSGELKEAQEKKKKAEAERKAIADKIGQYTKRLDDAERTVKSQMSAYIRQEEDRRRKEEEARLIAEAVEADDEEILDEPIKPEPVKPKVEGTYTVEVWKYEIVDVSKINPEYLVPDEPGIRKVVNGLKDKAGELLGPGVRVYSEKEVRIRI